MAWAARIGCMALAACLGIGIADAQQPGPTKSEGSYLGSRLMPTQPHGTCPPHVDPMYSAYAVVTGTDMRQRPWGFAIALREVLVKASGYPRLVGEPRVAELAEHADRYVACFSYLDLMADTPLHDEQGTYDRPHKLTVVFAPEKIDALLAEFGDKPWRGTRPVVVPILLVHGRKPPAYVLSAETPGQQDQRWAIGVSADTYGVKARIPTEAELAEWGVSVDRFPYPGAPAPAGKAADEAVVAGTLDWSETQPGWIGRWRCRCPGGDHRWGIDGVNYDAAFRDIMRGVVVLAAGRGSPD